MRRRMRSETARGMSAARVYSSHLEREGVLKVLGLTDDEQIEAPAAREVGHNDGPDGHRQEHLLPRQLAALRAGQSATWPSRHDSPRFAELTSTHVLRAHTLPNGCGCSSMELSMYVRSSSVMVGCSDNFSFRVPVPVNAPQGAGHVFANQKAHTRIQYCTSTHLYARNRRANER